MLGKSFKQFKALTNLSFRMSESRQVLKREKEAKLAQKIKDALNPTFIKVDDVTVGSSSCKYSFIEAGRCTTSSLNLLYSWGNL